MSRPARRGPWLPAEDLALIELVRISGANNWVRISQQLQNRSPKQCRERYHQNLKANLNHDPISPREGEIIEQLVREVGKRWAEIARRLGNRSDNAVKNWYNGSMNRRRRRLSQQHIGKQHDSRFFPNYHVSAGPRSRISRDRPSSLLFSQGEHTSVTWSQEATQLQPPPLGERRGVAQLQQDLYHTPRAQTFELQPVPTHPYLHLPSIQCQTTRHESRVDNHVVSPALSEISYTSSALTTPSLVSDSGSAPVCSPGTNIYPHAYPHQPQFSPVPAPSHLQLSTCVNDLQKYKLFSVEPNVPDQNAHSTFTIPYQSHQSSHMTESTASTLKGDPRDHRMRLANLLH